MKMKVPERDAIESLIAFGARHRMAMCWWNLKQFRETPAIPDRHAFTIEIFAHYMAQLEALEMVYFALRDRARQPHRSFLEYFLDVHIHEHFGDDEASLGQYCGRRILAELEGMTVERFERELGMPSYDELASARCGEAIEGKRTAKTEHEQNVLTLVQWMRQAIENKKHEPMHRAYMKVKHGFIVLGHPQSKNVYVLQDAEPLDSTNCVAEVLPLNNDEDFLSMLADETHVIGGMVINLLRLYLRRSPWDGCGHCPEDEGEVCDSGTADVASQTNT